MPSQFFESAAAFREWLEKHHDDVAELEVGFYRVGTGRGGLTYPQAVDQALCFGWIDGVRHRIDGESYSLRFTPRRVRSVWSKVNVDRVAALEREGLMTPAGRAAFEALDEKRSGVYSFEQRQAAELGPEREAQFRQNAGAWSFFSAQPPSYRRAAIWWVISANRGETQVSRLATLIEDSLNGRLIKPLDRSRLPSARKA